MTVLSIMNWLYHPAHLRPSFGSFEKQSEDTYLPSLSSHVYHDHEMKDLLFHKEFAREEGREVQKLSGLDQDRGTAYPFSCWCFVIRTRNWKEFWTDFFLPCFLNSVCKIDHLFSKIVAGIAIVYVDLATLPLRIITLPLRCLYNHIYRQEAHPFYQYLIAQGVSIQKLAKGYLYLDTLEKVETKRQDQFIRRERPFHFVTAPQGNVFQNSFECRGANKGEVPVFV